MALLLLVEAIHAVEQHRERKRAEDRKAWGDAQKAIDEELRRLSGAR